MTDSPEVAVIRTRLAAKVMKRGQADHDVDTLLGILDERDKEIARLKGERRGSGSFDQKLEDAGL